VRDTVYRGWGQLDSRARSGPRRRSGVRRPRVVLGVLWGARRGRRRRADAADSIPGLALALPAGLPSAGLL
jgi:hypothetical protein